MNDDVVVFLKLMISGAAIMLASIGTAALVIRGFSIPDDSLLAIFVGLGIAMPVTTGGMLLMFWWANK